MNIQYEFWKLVARINQSEAFKDLRIFYREEPWPCTFVFSALTVVFSFFFYLIFKLIQLTWPDSLYTVLVVLTVIGGVRQILNWISRG